MRKFLILILALPLIAASCDIGGLFDVSSGGVRGVMKSEDGGQTYRPFDALSPKGDISNTGTNALVFDTSNPDILYLGASAGIYKSIDGAKTWRFILAGISVADIAVDTTDANVVYAAGITGTNGKIIKSIDAGSSWVDVYSEPSKNNAALAIAVSPSSSSWVLAGFASGEIIRSSDGGHTWQAGKDLSDKIMKIRFNRSGTAYVLAFHKGLQKSVDFGLNWSGGSDTLTSDVISAFRGSISSVTAFFDVGLDSRQVGVLYLGTEQGLFRSVNEGTDWAFLSLPLKNSSLRVSSVAVNPNNSNDLIVAVGSTIFKSVNGGLTWETKVLATNSEVRSILINHQSNNLIYLGMGSQR